MEGSVLHNGFGAFRSRIESPALAAIADHWAQARGDGSMPGWSDLRPAALAPHLTRIWSFKYDRTSGQFTARLAGNRIMLGFNNSFRGTPLRDLHPAHVFEKVQSNMTRLVQGPCFYRGTGRLFRIGDYVAEGERIALPLATDGKQCDEAIGAADYGAPPLAYHQKPVELLHDVEEWFSLSGR
jgi:hypothetical protein